MIADLPEDIRQKVTQYLKVNDFIAAKALHDSWLSSSSQSQNHQKTADPREAAAVAA